MKKIKVFSTKIIAFDNAQFPAIELECADFIATDFIQSDLLKNKLTLLSSQNITTIFTSKNAVKSMASLGIINPNWDIYCIAPQTEKTILEYWKKANILATAINAGELLKKIAINNNQKIVFFAGDKHLPIIPEYFKNKSNDFETVIVYESKATPKRVTDTYDAYLFYSPSGVTSFFSVNKLSENAICVAIGATTANALRTFAPIKILQAANPTTEAMLEKLLEYDVEK